MSVELEWPDGVERLSLDEFERAVMDGEVPPETPIRFEVVTGGNFVPARELELYSALADRGFTDFRANLRRRGVPLVTFAILAIQLRVYLFSKTPGGTTWVLEHLANWSSGVLELGQVHRLITYGLTHVSFSHFLINSLFLLYLGWNLEAGFGRRNLFVIWFASTVFGGLLSLIVTPARPSIGGSAGDFGLLAAAVVFGWKYGGLIPARARRLFGWAVLPYLVFSFLMGARSADVDNWGHFGGLITGGFFATILEPQYYLKQHRANTAIRRTLAAVLVAGALALIFKGTALLKLDEMEVRGVSAAHPSTWSEEWTYSGDRG